MVIAVISGGFDPVHKGHVSLIQDAATIGSVFVGLNSDNWLVRKKGSYFMPFDERKSILSIMHGVIDVVGFDDTDGTAVDVLKIAKRVFHEHEIVFCNGGDRTDNNIPEYRFCQDNGIRMLFGVGGGKANSSSKLLSDWTAHATANKVDLYANLY